MTAAISLQGVVKRFGKFAAVDGLDLEIPHGTTFGLLGPNGAGKTTTIRMIMNITKPDAGEIRVLGEKMNDEAAGAHRLPARGARPLPEDEGRRPAPVLRDDQGRRQGRRR